MYALVLYTNKPVVPSGAGSVEMGIKLASAASKSDSIWAAFNHPTADSITASPTNAVKNEKKYGQENEKKYGQENEKQNINEHTEITEMYILSIFDVNDARCIKWTVGPLKEDIDNSAEKCGLTSTKYYLFIM